MDIIKNKAAISCIENAGFMVTTATPYTKVKYFGRVTLEKYYLWGGEGCLLKVIKRNNK